MKRNVGNIDSWIRLIIGAILFGFGVFSITGAFKWVLIIIGGALVLSSLFNYCPVYTIFKISTYKKQK